VFSCLDVLIRWKTVSGDFSIQFGVVDVHWQFVVSLMIPNWMARDTDSFKQHDIDTTDD
jgi:hypothetical protein